MQHKPAVYTKPRLLELADIREFTKKLAREVVERNIKYVLAES